MGKNTLSRLKQQEREIRKNLILDAAERVFSTKPYNAVSMQEIANEAGLAKSSIYTYFSTQEALFVEAAMRDACLLFSNLEAIQAEKKKPDLGKVIDCFLDFFANRDAFFKMSAQFMLYGNISAESMDKLNPVTRRMLNIFDTTFSRHGYKGDVRLMSHTLFATLSGILIAYRKYPGRSDQEILRHMKRIGKNVKEMIQVLIRQNL
jgi:AcrR family transcriptional regulator